MEAPFGAFGAAIRGVWRRYSGRLEAVFSRREERGERREERDYLTPECSAAEYSRTSYLAPRTSNLLLTSYNFV